MTANLIHGHRPGRLALPAVLSLAAALVPVTPVVAQVLGWSVGTGGGTIVHTTDGGALWSAQTSGASATSVLDGVAFVDASNGWTVGGTGFGGLILHTSGGGTVWSPQTSGVSGTSLLGLSFADTMNGWAVGGGGIIIHTADGGAD